MRRKLAYTLTALTVLLVLSATCVPSISASYVAGVKVGTKANYSLSQTGLTAINAAMTEVTAVNGAIISFSKTEYNVDHSVNNFHSYTYDVSINENLFWYLAANLVVHDPIFIGANWWINQTITGYSIGGETWTANYMNGTISGTNVIAYWDKPTGLLLYWRYHQASLWTNLTLTSASIPLDWVPFAIVGGIAAITVIAIVILLRRRRK